MLRSMRRLLDVPAVAELLAELTDRGVTVLDQLTDDDLGGGLNWSST